MEISPQLRVTVNNKTAPCSASHHSILSISMFYLFSYLEFGCNEMLLLWSVKIQVSDLVLHLGVEGGLPELLTGPDGVILHARVGILVHARGQFLQESNEKHQ